VSGSVETPVNRFAVVGAGWRTLFYLRVVAAPGKRFQLSGVVTQSQGRAEELKAVAFKNDY
jgi:predicted dehydrogenase